MKKNHPQAALFNQGGSSGVAQTSAAASNPPATPAPAVHANFKDERAEKLRKKAKTFLDERQKIKARATSLWSYIDVTNNFDQARFFQENAEQVFHVTFEVCMHQIEKIKQRNDRPTSWNSKEMLSLQKTLLLVRKIFLYVPELMRNGWQRKNIATLLTHILDHGNHPRLRLLGFRLLLLWLNDQVVEYPECMELFANTVSLDLFLVDDIRVAMGEGPVVANEESPTSPTTAAGGGGVRLGGVSIGFMGKGGGNASGSGGVGATAAGLPGPGAGLMGWVLKGEVVRLEQEFIFADDRPPLLPNPNPPTFHDSIALLQVFVFNLVRLAYVAAGSPPPPDEYEFPPGDNIEPDDGIATGVGIDAASASAKFLFKIFRQWYLVKLVPEIARQLKVDGVQRAAANFGFPACPPTILRAMLTFLIKYCLDNNASPALPSLFFPSPSPATPILKSIVFSSHENRELLHEILRQCLVLPPTNHQYRDIVRGAVHIIGVWTLSGEEERPAFLRRSINLTPSSSSASLSTLVDNTNTTPAPNPELTVTAPVTTTTDKLFTSPLIIPNNYPAPANYADANIYLRKYFRLVRLIFEEHTPESLGITGGAAIAPGGVGPTGVTLGPTTTVGGAGSSGNANNVVAKDVGAASVAGVGVQAGGVSLSDWEAIVALYKDALGLYRAVITVGAIELESQSWETMLRCLLEIQAHIMNRPDKCAVVLVPALAEELADFMVETLLHAFVRSNTTNVELWTDLKKQMAVATRLGQAVVGQWVKTVNKLTRILSTHLYGVDIDAILGRAGIPGSLFHPISDYLNDNSQSSRARPRSTKVRTRHLSLHEQSPSPSRTRLSAPQGFGSAGQVVDPLQQRLSLPATSNANPVDLSSVSSSSSSSTGTVRDVRDDNRAPAPQPSSSSTLSPTVGTNRNDRMGRRAMSVHQDFGALWSESNSKLLSLVHPSSSSSTVGTGSIGGGSIGGGGPGPFGTNNGSSLALASSDLTLMEESGEEDERDFLGGAFGIHGSPGGGNKDSKVEKDREQRREIAILGAIGMNSGISTVSAVSAESGLEGGKAYVEVDRKSVASLNERGGPEDLVHSTKSNRTSASSVLPGGGDSTSNGLTTGAGVNEKLPNVLAIFKSPEFGNLATATAWDGQRALVAWKNIVCALGNVNAIQNPQNHTTAILCLVEVWDMLALVRAHQPFAGVPVPALYELAPWFFQAADLLSTYAVGRAAAYGCLCRIMCRRADQPYPEELLSHFYQTLLKGLTSMDETVVHAIVTNSTRLFGLCLPGSYILVPTVVETIGKVLLEDVQQTYPQDVYYSCLTILASLVCVSNHLAGLRLPAVTLEKMARGHGRSGSAAPEVEFSHIKVMLKDVLVGLIAAENAPRRLERPPETHGMLLGSVCVLLLDELQNSSPDPAIVKDSLLSLLDHLYLSNLPVVNVAVDCLNTLAQNYHAEADPKGIIVQEVFARLIDALNAHLKLQEASAKPGRGCIIARLFYCLLEWLMVIEPHILTDTELCQLVFDVLEYGLHVASDDTEKILPHPPISPKGQRKRDLQLKFKLGPERRPSLGGDYGHLVVGSDIGEDDEDFVKTAAESVLLHMLHHFNNFAPPFGPAMISSTILGPGIADDKLSDENVEHYQYFTFNDTTLLTFVESPRSNGAVSHARIIIRNVTGRYTWDAQLFYKAIMTKPTGGRVNGKHGVGSSDNIANGNEAGSRAANVGVTDRLILRDGAVRESSRTDEIEQITYNRQRGEMPKWQSDNHAETIDMLDQLLQFIGETSPDSTIQAARPLNAPRPLSPNQESVVSNVDALLNRHIQEELECTEPRADSPISPEGSASYRDKRHSTELPPKFPPYIYQTQHNLPTPSKSSSISSVSSNPTPVDYSLSKTFVHVTPPEAEKPHAPYQQCRLLMSHLGLLNYDYLKDGSFYMLNKTPALYRDIRGLDKKYGRETMKIGVIYVGPGQEDEQSILYNARGSNLYNDFVASIGWEVDLATHPGYLGGLERNLTNGARATYYCSSTVEMIFHDATKMPTDPNDPKQVRKKRHIGNDHVHIVWNEHHRDYRPGTIGGDFGNAQIIITPMLNGLFAIRVHRDQKVPFFGPLLNGMVVSRAVLGSLVRTTAMNAFRATLHPASQTMYRHMYAHRAGDIHIITQRHKVVKWNFERFMGHIFMPDEDHKET